jgi:CrcB protein
VHRGYFVGAGTAHALEPRQPGRKEHGAEKNLEVRYPFRFGNKVRKMGIYAVAAVGTGAALGAWLRWWFGAILNPVFPTLPLGTLAANLIGGLLVGIAVEYFHHNATLPPEARLFVITGFLGGLTTFSTFSAETVTLILREQYYWAGTIIFGHLAGSLAMTFLGIMAIRWLAQH